MTFESVVKETVSIKLSEIVFDEGLYPRVNGHDPETVQTYARDMEQIEAADYVAIAEEYFQKKCLPDEVVHHIDGNRENNAAENLVIMKRLQHSRLHNGLMGALDQWKEKVSRPLCGDCLYTRIYREHRGIHNDLVIESMFTIFHFDRDKLFENHKQERNKVLELCEEMYNKSVEWQRQNDHYCYANKNMHVVKRG